MKHLGLHEFPQKIDVNDAKSFNSTILNKLNIPFHKDLNGETFGDMFTENNAVKFVNNEGEVNLLLDLDNNDVIKSLLVSEIFFNDFLNYNEDYQTSNSFHTKLTLTNDVFQNDLNLSTDATVYIDSTVSVNIVELIFADAQNAGAAHDSFVPYMGSGLPLFTRYINTTDSTVIEQMSEFNSIELVGNKILLTLPDNDQFNSITTSDRVEIITFKFVDNISEEPMISLPPHAHSLSQISDLSGTTNVENGFIKLDGSHLKFGFDQTLWLSQARLSNTVFTKDYQVQLNNEKRFILNTQSSTIDDQVGYEETVIDLGGDSTAIEYDMTSVELTFNDELQLLTQTGWVAVNTSVNTISDFTNFQNKYLVEIIEFNYDQVFGSESNVNPLLNIRYEQRDMTSVNEFKVYDIDVSSNRITTIAGYYEIAVIQPNINTIPSISLNYTSLSKDFKNDIMLTKPTSFMDNNETLRLNIHDRSLLNVEFNDSTISTLELVLEKFDILSNTQNVEHGAVTVDVKLLVDRGMYRLIPNTDMYTFNASFY